MELYSAPKERQNLPAEHPVYFSRTRLLLGALAGLAGVVGFGALAYSGKAEGKMGIWYFDLFLVLGAGLILFRNIKGLMQIGKPAFIISHAGITRSDGTFVAWENMTSNTHMTQRVNFIPIAQSIMIKTSLASPKKLSIPAMALAIRSDEYLALCDAYNAAK